MPNSWILSSIATFSRGKYVAAAVAVAAVYFATAQLGLVFAIPPGQATVVWPPAGIAVAAVFLIGFQLWPAIWLASFAVSASTGVGPGLAAGIATGNTLEAVLAGWLLKRWLSPDPFGGVRDVCVFLLVALFACLPAATVGALAVLLQGQDGGSAFGANWATWFLGDLAGVAIVFPPCLAWAYKGWTRVSLARGLEVTLVILLQGLLGFALYGGILPERRFEPLLYLPMVLVIWCCLRFGLLEVTVGTLVFSLAAIVGTWAGVGGSGSPVVHEDFFDLQLLLFTYALTALAVSSIVGGQRAARSSSVRSQTELRHQTRERRRLEAWFHELLTASPDALIVSDSQGRILLTNKAAESLFGYSREEMIGQSIEVLVPARMRGHHRVLREQYARSPHVRLMGEGMELCACRKDGTEFAAEITLGPAQTDDGLVVFSAIRDITPRKQAEQALRDSEERFTLAVKGTDAGIWDWDLRTNDVYFSPRWKSMLGYVEDEISHEFHEWETRLHPEDRERALHTVREYLEGSFPDFELEHRLRHKDGSYRWILARGAVVCDATGKPYRMAGSHLDITERKALEEKLRQQLAQLIAAEEIQAQLLPKEAPDLPGFDIAGRCYPAEYAAGDQFDFLFLKSGAFLAVISDVAGHGVGPAILMAFFHARLRSLAGLHTDLCELVTQVNQLIERESPERRFITLLATKIDPRARTLAYVRCGHPPGFIMDAAGEITSWMHCGGLPLGVLADVQYTCSDPIQLHAGDVVVLLTDGVLEANSPDQGCFGMERTVQVVREHRDRTAEQIIAAIREVLEQYTARSELSDDVTLVVTKVQ